MPPTGTVKPPSSQAAGQEAVGWHQWCHCVSSEVSPAGAGHFQEQWEGHGVSELAGDVWGKASATERVGPHNMGEGGERSLQHVLAARMGHLHVWSLCLVLVDRWRCLRDTLQPLRAGAAPMATPRPLRQKMVKLCPGNDRENQPLTLHGARPSAAPATSNRPGESCVCLGIRYSYQDYLLIP